MRASGRATKCHSSLDALVAAFDAIGPSRSHDTCRALPGHRHSGTVTWLRRIATGVGFAVILFDDLGYGDLLVQGNCLIRTPRIDMLDAMTGGVEQNPRGWR